MKSVILIAAPAAGKGTEAVKLEEQFHIPHISTGDLLRDAVKQGTEYASIIEEYQNKGEFVPFEIVLICTAFNPLPALTFNPLRACSITPSS